MHFVLTSCCLSVPSWISIPVVRMKSAQVDPATVVGRLRRFQDDKILHLVMSDEFEERGRSFARGLDPLFETADIPDYSNESMQYCE